MSGADAREFWLVGASVVDVVSGKTVPQNIHIAGGKIAGLGGTPPEGARVAGASGRYVAPGLIDAHVHILGLADIPPGEQKVRALDYARAHLRKGVVMARDLGELSPLGGDAAAVEFAASIRGGARDCCEVLTSGRMLSSASGRRDIAVSASKSNIADSDDEIIGFIRTQKQLGADLIKVMATGSGHDKGVRHCYYSLEQMRLITRESHRAGMKVAVHATTPAGVETCVSTGVDSVEHAPLISDACLAKMRDAGVYYVPTLCVYRHLAERWPGPAGEAALSTAESHRVTLPKAYAAGVNLAAGSDNPGPCGFGGREPQVLGEMLAMRGLGVEAIDCIRAATLNAARLLGVENRLGSVAPGKDADLIVLNGNPLEDLNVFDRAEQVYKAGRPVIL